MQGNVDREAALQEQRSAAPKIPSRSRLWGRNRHYDTPVCSRWARKYVLLSRQVIKLVCFPALVVCTNNGSPWQKLASWQGSMLERRSRRAYLPIFLQTQLGERRHI